MKPRHDGVTGPLPVAQPPAPGGPGRASSPAPPAASWAAGALVLNALVWGTSWWPLRQFEAAGLHPLWATALIYSVVVLAISLARPSAWRELLRAPTLWWLVLAAGTTNACFNWGVTIGDVVRVVLLFYLMPLWAVLLARLLLNEPFTINTALRVTLALIGAAIVLWPIDATTGARTSALPLPANLPEWLGVLGGFTFALNNVILRREAHRPEAARALAMFVGGAGVSAVLAASMTASGAIAPPPAPAFVWVAGGLGMALAFLFGNLALQYGASRLRAGTTAVIMITEVVFASASAVLLGAGTLTPSVLTGGALIVGAALLASRE